MTDLVLQGLGEKTLYVDRACLVLSFDKISNQIRIIPIEHISCVEVSEPQDYHRGYIYFRTPVANRPIKKSVMGRDVTADDDMVFFDGQENYETALNIQKYISDFFLTRHEQ